MKRGAAQPRHEIEEFSMTTDRGAHDERSGTIADRLIEHVSDAAERMGEAAHAIVEGVQDRVQQLTSLLQRGEPTQVGQPLPDDDRPVRPKSHSSTWLAWRDDRWVPARRVKDMGWVWSE
jgi:hypothetical protein